MVVGTVGGTAVMPFSARAVGGWESRVESRLRPIAVRCVQGNNLDGGTRSRMMDDGTIDSAGVNR